MKADQLLIVVCFWFFKVLIFGKLEAASFDGGCAMETLTNKTAYKKRKKDDL